MRTFNLTREQLDILERCKRSCVYFIRHFVKVKHPGAGEIDFNPWAYQVDALKAFRTHRFNIFKKTRQAGISKVAGAFALWFAMFHGTKKILIVSKKDDDAITFLADNIKFPFDHLPEWMRAIWDPTDTTRGGKCNEHELKFAEDIGGSTIRSLTSAPNVLRSHSSSLNIIDEAAFIEKMDVMWAAGYPTLVHGGHVIIISTCNGLGDWYWNTYVDGEAGLNDFNTIKVNWWDMTWRLEFVDQITGEFRVIAPTDGIRKCTTKEELQKYGPYWSPWLEEQYRNLQERGEVWKFRQEVLAEFVGSGNTILDLGALNQVKTTIREHFSRISGPQKYVHPITGDQSLIDMTGGNVDEGLWIWEKPNRGKEAVKEGKKVIVAGESAHSYVMGVDLATGRGNDYFTIEVIDCDTMEQVAELMIRCLPMQFMEMVDRVGRYYNNALVVVESNFGGEAFIDDLRIKYSYPKLWRKKTIDDKPNRVGTSQVSYAKYGFHTNDSSKAILNKLLVDNIREDGNGLKIFSPRLHKQLQIYVRKRDRNGRDTGKTQAEEGPGNHDDLVIAIALALVGVPDAVGYDSDGLAPGYQTEADDFDSAQSAVDLDKFLQKGNSSLALPVIPTAEPDKDMTIMYEISKYASELGAMPMTDGGTYVPFKAPDWRV